MAAGAIALPKPALPRGVSLAESFARRKTTRAFARRPLPAQALSNLLWAACGVNRRRGPFGTAGRTAASASNSQEVDVYVCLAQAAYRYDATRHRLVEVVAEDLRPLALGAGQSLSQGRIGADAAARLIFVADIDRLVHTQGFQEPGLHQPAIQKSYYFVDTGMIAANVYLYAAATGLAAWFHNCDRAALARKLGLRKDQRVLFGQTVGYPARAAPRRPA